MVNERISSETIAIPHLCRLLLQPRMKERLKSIGRVQPHQGWNLERHRHQVNELITIQSGRMWAKTDDGHFYEANRGNLLLYPSGCWHEERSDDAAPVDNIYMAFEGQIANRVLLLEDSHQRVIPMMRWLWQEKSRDTEHFESVKNHYFQIIILEVRRILESNGSKGQLETLFEFIEQNLSSELNIETLAKQFSMSKFHFIRTFKSLTGKTPMEEVRRLRLESARDLIRRTNLPLKAVAERVGLANEYHLSRLFRRHFGQSSKAYRTRTTRV